MKTYIICNSKTGFTRRYADWIAQELGGTVLPYKTYQSEAIGADDRIIFGSRIFGGKIEHFDKIKSRFKNHRNLIVFVTGGTPMAVSDAIEKLWVANFTEKERASIPHFYMQGGINYEKMTFLNRTMMKTAAKLMSRGAEKEEKDEAETGFMKKLQSSYDISSREYIKPLVDYVNGSL